MSISPSARAADDLPSTLQIPCSVAMYCTSTRGAVAGPCVTAEILAIAQCTDNDAGYATDAKLYTGAHERRCADQYQ
jgi:hypothetical protein